MTKPSVVLIDVGFTLLFVDGATIADLARSVGVTVDAQAIDSSDREIYDLLHQHGWAQTTQQQTPADAGVIFFERVLGLLAPTIDGTERRRAAKAIWQHHLKRNVWRRPGVGVSAALDSMHRAGIKLVALSNSEGTVEDLLKDTGLDGFFETIIDSWVVGVAKPDPKIFCLALERVGGQKHQALMVGDSLYHDIAGAQAAGIGAVLIDPFDRYPTAPVPRFSDFATFAADFLER